MRDQALDRLYELLPAIYRIRDEERGSPLRALLRVIAEQVNVVENDIAGLYENWFIETCDDWAVPYIGELIDHRPVREAGEPGDVISAQSRMRNRILVPRREVANTIRNRRRKGTLALLELLARDVADWPARAVEFYRLLGWTQHLDHLREERGRTTELRKIDALTRIDGPFDAIVHTIEIRRPNSARSQGRYNVPSVGVFVWRLKPYTVGGDHQHRSAILADPFLTKTPAYCLERIGAHCFTFSVLGHDTQLFVMPQPEPDPTHIAEELNLPVPIRRWAFDNRPAGGGGNPERYLRKTDFYGVGKSIEIWAPGWGTYDPSRPLPPEAIDPADLSDWSYRPAPGHVAVDPVLGRMIFRPSPQPRQRVRVSYVYGFSADVGGGEYNRPLSQPAGAILVQVGAGKDTTRIGDAWKQVQDAWSKKPGEPQSGVIEIVDSEVFTEQLDIQLQEGQSLQLRAASRVRPVLRLIDWQTDLPPDALCITLSHGSRMTLDGLLVTGRSVAIRASEADRATQAQHENEAGSATDICPAQLFIRHCTFVPGWTVGCDCSPECPAEPSLELINVRVRVRIEHSIIGSIQVTEDQVHVDPITIMIADTILDATGNDREALGAPGRPVAHAVLTMLRCTVFGEVLVHAIELAENCIFNSCLNVARRQLGCMRFCYVPEGCRTPRRYHCQPDLAKQAIDSKLRGEAEKAKKASTAVLPRQRLEAEVAAAKAREGARVRPSFNSVRYGQPAYAQLADLCAEEIKRGADDESEMGAFHDLFNPQREANLRARLDEYTPASSQVGIFFVD